MDLVAAILIVLALVAVLVAVFILTGRIKEKSAPEAEKSETEQAAENDAVTAEENEELPEEESCEVTAVQRVCMICGEVLNGQVGFCPVCGEKV